MAMPETSVDENDLPALSENKVRSSGQIPGVQSVPIAEGEYNLANDQLRPRVLGANPRHNFRPFGGRKSVHTRYSLLAPLKSGHWSATYFSTASRTTHA